MSEQTEQLEKIEKYFHEVIEIVVCGAFPERQLPPPKLGVEIIDAPKPSFHGIYSMFGGISYRILSEEGKLKLIAIAGSRMDPNYEKRFEITSEGWREIPSLTN